MVGEILLKGNGNMQTDELFTSVEHAAVRGLMLRLSPTEFRALALRVWGSRSIEDISSALCVDWDRADQIVSRAMKKLKLLCLSHPAFATRLPDRESRTSFKESVLEKEN